MTSPPSRRSMLDSMSKCYRIGVLWPSINIDQACAAPARSESSHLCNGDWENIFFLVGTDLGGVGVMNGARANITRYCRSLSTLPVGADVRQPRFFGPGGERAPKPAGAFSGFRVSKVEWPGSSTFLRRLLKQCAASKLRANARGRPIRARDCPLGDLTCCPQSRHRADH